MLLALKIVLEQGGATAPTFKEARRPLKAVKRDPAAFDEPLMAQSASIE